MDLTNKRLKKVAPSENGWPIIPIAIYTKKKSTAKRNTKHRR